MKFLFNVIATLFFFISSNAQVITTVAGNGVCGYDGEGGAASSAKLWLPEGVAVDENANLFICDHMCIRKVSPATGGVITTFAGAGTSTGYSGDGGAANSALVNGVHDVAVDKYGNVYLADGGNNRVRKVTAVDGVINTIAGTGIPGYNGDGMPATAAQLNSPFGVAVDDTGNVYVADLHNRRIRKISTSGIISTVAGTGVKGFSGDSGMADTAMLHHPILVKLDRQGNIYIADSTRIRKINTAGIITTVAGIATFGFSGDGGPATNAEIVPYAIALDTLGNLYIADDGRIRKVNVSGIINTIAGTGLPYYNGDGINPLLANLWSPSGVAVNYLGEIFVGDQRNCRVRKIGNATDAVTGVQISPEGLKIFPNPANVNCVITVASASGNQVRMKVANIYGVEVFSQIMPVNKGVTFPTPWPPGVYVVTVYVDGRQITGRLTIL